MTQAWRLWPRSRLLRLVLVGAIAMFALLLIQQLGQPYVIDEAEFPLVAEAASRSGLPIYYHGELRPVDIGTWHPPLYVYALAGWIQLFGDSHVAVRAFGGLCALLTAATGAATCRLLVPRFADAAGVAFVALYLLNPLVISSALVPDIDGTVGVFSLTLGLHAVVLAIVAPGPRGRDVMLLGLSLGLAVSTKLTTPLALVPIVLVALSLSGRRPAAALQDFARVLGVAAAFFLLWWGALAALTSLEFAFPFRFTYDSLVTKGGGVGLGERLSSLVPNRYTVFWLDPVLLVLAGVAAVVAVRRWRTPDARAVLLVSLFALGTVALYDVITEPVFRFPKYWIAAVPAATIAAVWLVATSVGAARLALRSRASPVAVPLGLVIAFGLSHVLLARAVASTPEVVPIRSLAATSAMILAFTVLLVAALKADRRSAVVAAALTGAVLTFGMHGLALATVQRSADYSTRYYYGERGFEQAVADVRTLTPGNEPVLAAKDIGFEAGRPYFEDALLFPDPMALERLLQARTTPVAVTRKGYDYSEPVFPVAFEVIRRYMVPVFDRPGSGFVVWRLRPVSTAS